MPENRSPCAGAQRLARRITRSVSVARDGNGNGDDGTFLLGLRQLGQHWAATCKHFPNFVQQGCTGVSPPVLPTPLHAMAPPVDALRAFSSYRRLQLARSALLPTSTDSTDKMIIGICGSMSVRSSAVCPSAT